MPMIVITTKSSTKVNPIGDFEWKFGNVTSAERIPNPFSNSEFSKSPNLHVSILQLEIDRIASRPHVRGETLKSQGRHNAWE